MVRIPIHSCPWFAVNCSPLAASPTPRHPTDHVRYLYRRHQQHHPSSLIQSQSNKWQLLSKRIKLINSQNQIFNYNFKNSGSRVTLKIVYELILSFLKLMTIGPDRQSAKMSPLRVICKKKHQIYLISWWKVSFEAFSAITFGSILYGKFTVLKTAVIITIMINFKGKRPLYVRPQRVFKVTPAPMFFLSKVLKIYIWPLRSTAEIIDCRFWSIKKRKVGCVQCAHSNSAEWALNLFYSSKLKTVLEHDSASQVEFYRWNRSTQKNEKSDVVLNDFEFANAMHGKFQ